MYQIQIRDAKDEEWRPLCDWIEDMETAFELASRALIYFIKITVGKQGNDPRLMAKEFPNYCRVQKKMKDGTIITLPHYVEATLEEVTYH